MDENYKRTIMTGELFFSTKKIFLSGDSTGAVVGNNSDYLGFVDAYERYGLSLSANAIDKLMNPAPHKQPQGNSLAYADGRCYGGLTVGVRDERLLSLEVNITAPSRAAYLTRYGMLCEEVLNAGRGEVIYLRTPYQPGVCYRLVYQTCEQFQQWINSGTALLTISFIEPHPEMRVVDALPYLPSVTVEMSPHTVNTNAYRMLNNTEHFVASASCENETVDYRFVWSSSNENVARLGTIDGGSAYCTYVGLGRATIRVDLTVNGFVLASDRFTVNVQGGVHA